MSIQSKRLVLRLGSLFFCVFWALASAQEIKDCPYPIKSWDGPSVLESLDLKLSGVSRNQAIGYLLSEYKKPAAESFAVPILFYLSATEENAKLKHFYEELGLELSGGTPLNRSRENFPQRKGFKTGQKTLEELCAKLDRLSKAGRK